MTDIAPENRFICDRMAGSLCRHLRLLGYDTRDANDLPPGNPKEDTLLLSIASEENRLLLTRDVELSQRDKERVIYLSGDNLEDQIRQLIRSGLIVPELRLIRCSICNHLLTPITAETLIQRRTVITQIVPDISELDAMCWCQHCKKVYWEGSHTRNMRVTIQAMKQDCEIRPGE